MSKVWNIGHLLRTHRTARWTDAQREHAEAMENLYVFSNFRHEDEGRSRVLIARFENSKDALLGSTAPDGLALAEKLCNLWAVDQDKNEMIFKRADMEELFRMAAAIREKTGQ